jgi:HEAT repeat protein
VISEALRSLSELAVKDRILMFLSLSVLFFVFLSLVLGLWAIGLRLRNRIHERRWRVLEKSWEGHLLNYLSGEEKVEALQAKIQFRDRPFFLDYLLRYTRRLWGEEAQLIVDLARPFVETAVAQSRQGTPEDRARAVYTLGIFGLPDFAKEVIAALDDPSPLVVMVAARSLLRKERADWAVPVVHHLHRLETWSIPLLATMLAKVGEPLAQTLRELFGDPQRMVRVRVICAEALGKLTDAASAGLAVRILETERARDLVAASLRLLSTVGTEDHLPAALRWMDSDDYAIRAHAATALARLGGPEVIPTLQKAFEDPDHWVALHAAKGLKERGATSILEGWATSGHRRSDLARQVLAEAQPVT